MRGLAPTSLMVEGDTLGHLGLIYLAVVIFVVGALRTRREGDDVATTETLLCAKCGGPGDGWKCAICGSVAGEHDAGHLHVGSDRYCTIRCAACGEADVLCTCV